MKSRLCGTLIGCLLAIGCGGTEDTSGSSGGAGGSSAGAGGSSAGAGGSAGTGGSTGGSGGVGLPLPTDCVLPQTASLGTANPLIGIGSLVYAPKTGGCAVSGGSLMLEPGSVFIFGRVTATDMVTRLINVRPWAQWEWVSLSAGKPFQSSMDEVTVPEDTDITAVIRDDAQGLELTLVFNVSTGDDVTVSSVSVM